MAAFTSSGIDQRAMLVSSDALAIYFPSGDQEMSEIPR